MAKVIETNLFVDKDNNIKDHQSRVIEVESWDSFIDEIKNAKFINRISIIGNMIGNTVPRCSKVENLIYDEKHLSCDIYNYAKVKTRKLAYLID